MERGDGEAVSVCQWRCLSVSGATMARRWSGDSSVGRAEDCRCDEQKSLGRWFKSASPEPVPFSSLPTTLLRPHNSPTTLAFGGFW